VTKKLIDESFRVGEALLPSPQALTATAPIASAAIRSIITSSVLIYEITMAPGCLGGKNFRMFTTNF
jgi:hypothetical protein